MFRKKQEEKPQQVKCEECKHYIDKEDAQVITGPPDAYYCSIHKKPYTRRKVNFPEFLFLTDRQYMFEDEIMADFKVYYYKEFEVNEQGEPIGYKKIK